jgi:DNA-binding MarR family transcriptional regulator
VASPLADSAAYPEEVRELLRVCNEILMLGEPHIFRVWNNTGLTLTQIRILRSLREGPVPAGLLAEQAGVSAPSLTRILTRLEELGLVTREVDPVDRRRIDVALTRGGSTFFKAPPILRFSAFERAARIMPAEDRVRITRTLRELRDAVRAQIPQDDLTVAAGLSPERTLNSLDPNADS